MSKSLRILIVEDSEDDARLLLRELQRGGYQVTHQRVETAEALNAALDRQVWDIVISDYSMPQFSGSAALALVQKKGLDLPFIIMSGTIGEEIAVETMRAGAHDYIMKNNLTRLIPVIERELIEATNRRERRQSEEMVKYLAFYDTLTGLPNRNMLYDSLLNAVRVNNAEKNNMALLLLDLDHFQEINDTLGHPRGDVLLQEVGRRIRQALWEQDMVARLGGDEFGVLLSKLADVRDAHVVSRKILKALELPFTIEDTPIAVGASIGIALYPKHGESADVLFQRADVALYVAKRKGLGYTVYTPEQDQYNPRRLALMGELRYAIESGQIFPIYQPKIDIQIGQVVGVEALVRWKHPQYGMILPTDFIHLTERTGLVHLFAHRILNAALRQCQAWRHMGFPLTVAVNLSARNLEDPQLPDRIAELLQTNGMRAEWLELEITESVIMADPARAREVLSRLNKMGLRLSIDDFGTGYSSLGYLRKLPVHDVKIDKTFVLDMVENEDDGVIVRSIIDLAHNLGLKVVAEGVEKQEVLDRLKDLGCDLAQGYHMSRPLPAPELTQWLTQSTWGVKRV
jgi:diguanylate cyclase (GGDEF)-like protein